MNDKKEDIDNESNDSISYEEAESRRSYWNRLEHMELSLKSLFSVGLGLLSFKKNHVATHAIIHGSLDIKKNLWKLSVFSMIPVFVLTICMIIGGSFVSEEAKNMDGMTLNVTANFATFSILLILLTLFVFLTWLNIICHAYITNWFSKLLFKKTTDSDKLKLVIGYWIATAMFAITTAQILGFMFSATIFFFLSFAILFGVFFLIMINYHRSIGYALNIGGWKSFIITVIQYMLMTVISIVVSLLTKTLIS